MQRRVCLWFRLEQKNNGAIQKGVLSCFISRCVCYMKGEWLHHLGIRLRQRSLYCTLSVTVLFSSTHFPGFCLGRVCHSRYEKVWINMKSRCGWQQNGILYSGNFFCFKRSRQLTATHKLQRKITHVITIRGEDRMSNSGLQKRHCPQYMTWIFTSFF